MIPMFIVIRIRNSRHKFGLWVPIFLLWLLLLPLVLVLLPFFVIGCLIVRVNPWRACVAGWQLLTGLAGTHVHIDKEQAQEKVLVRII
jgi:hypothetical protein